MSKLNEPISYPRPLLLPLFSLKYSMPLIISIYCLLDFEHFSNTTHILNYNYHLIKPKRNRKKRKIKNI